VNDAVRGDTAIRCQSSAKKEPSGNLPSDERRGVSPGSETSREEIAAATEYAFRDQPARLADLLESAVAQRATPATIAALRTLPADQVFSSVDDLWAHLPDVPRLCG
jgi:hypothetical protein